MATPHNVVDPIEADEFETDPGLDVISLASSTTSVTSSILRGRRENGRTYHAYKEGAYAVPQDEIEQDRLDLQHHLYLLAFDGKLSLVPKDGTKQIQRVLDVGTGTGIWAIDYGDEHPEAQVLGVDLSPIQPEFLPPNVTFEVDDMEERWLYHDKFDLIHARLMTGSFQDWPKFFQQTYQFTTPGGYLEVTDIIFEPRCDDGTLKPDSTLSKWCDLLLEASVKIGRPLDSTRQHKKQMEEAGWTNIVERKDILPGGRWPKDAKLKELGTWNRENVLSGAEGFTLALFTRVLGWSIEEVQTFLVDVRTQLKDPKVHYYMEVFTYLGQKPE